MEFSEARTKCMAGMTNDENLESEKIRETVRAEERRRLALDLHDTLGQVLALTRLQLARIQQAVRDPIHPDRQAWLQTTIDALVPEIDLAMQTVQTQMFSLLQPVYREGELASALDNECQAFSRRTGIPCHGRCESLNLDAERGQLLLLILREALVNIARHSRATHVEVSLSRSEERGILGVSDNGIGMDASRVSGTDCFGLQRMQERARALGGEITIDSRPHEQTLLMFSFPLDHHQKNKPLHD